MRVTWFCFISHIFAEEEVPTETISVLVRLFLSSCRRFWMLGERNAKHTQTDPLDIKTKDTPTATQNRKRNSNLGQNRHADRNNNKLIN
jgi:hypothetical protein